MQFTRKILIVLLAIGFSFGFQSCKKSEEEPSRTELLTIAQGWKIESVDGNGDEIVDAFIPLYMELMPPELRTPESEEEIRMDMDLNADFEIEPCDEDNTMFFKKSGNMVEHKGVIQCEGEEVETAVVNTWIFDEDESHLILTDNHDGTIQNFEITTLTESRLSISLRMPVREYMVQLPDVEGYEAFAEKVFVINIHFRAN